MAVDKESFLSKNLLGILSFFFSMATAVGASWTMQVRHDEKIAANQAAIAELKHEINEKVDQKEMEELKDTLDEMKGDIKDLLRAQASHNPRR